MAMVFAAIAAIATVLTLAMPLLASDTLGKRMKAVAVEREKMRQRERERMARGEKVALRRTPKQYMQTVVDQFNLGKWVGQEEARQLLVQAGYRGHAPYIAFLFFRLVVPAGWRRRSAFASRRPIWACICRACSSRTRSRSASCRSSGRSRTRWTCF